MNDSLIEVAVYTTIGNVVENFAINVGNINIINDFICNLDEGCGIKFDNEVVNKVVKNIAARSAIGMRIIPFSITDYSGYYTLVVNEI